MRTCGTRLVALSGHAQPEDVQMALDAGFDALVAKPCELRQIELALTLDRESGPPASAHRGREEGEAARYRDPYVSAGRDGP
jgi:CheY-like chemotaxis protein